MAYGEPNYDIAPPPWYGKIREGTPPPVSRFTPPNAGVSPSYEEKQMLIDARLAPGYLGKVANRFSRAYYDDGSGTPTGPAPTPTTPRTPRTHGGRRRPPTTGTTSTSTPTTPTTPTATPTTPTATPTPPTTPIVTPTTPATTPTIPTVPVTLRTPTRPTVSVPGLPPTTTPTVPTSPLVDRITFPPFDADRDVPPPIPTRVTPVDWTLLPPVDASGIDVPPPPKRSRGVEFDWDLPPMAETATGLPVGPLATSVPPPPGAPVETPTLPTGTWSVPEGYGDVLSPDWRRTDSPADDIDSIFTPRVPGPSSTREVTDEEFLNNFLNMGKSRTKKRPPKG